MAEAVLAVLGVVLAAFCVWLTVRIVNRRERWAKRTAIALFFMLVVYPLSWGPALFIYQSNDRPEWAYGPMQIYAPTAWLLRSTEKQRPWLIEPYRRYIFGCMVKGK